MRWQEAGDQEALEQLLQREVYAIKRRIRREIQPGTSPSQSASDVAQEAASRWLGLRSSPYFRSPAALRAYLWTTALNLLRRHMQDRQLPASAYEAHGLLEASLVTSDGASEEVLAQERSVALHLALQLLRPCERRILELVYFEGKDPQAAALVLGIEPENARMRLTRARRALAIKLRAWNEIVEGV